MRQVARRNDPAPTRLQYRLQRVWLTPAFWWFLRFGLPVAVLALGLVWTFSSEDRREAIYAWGVDIKRSVEERPEFMVNLLAIDGASDPVAREIRETLSVNLPASSFDLDLEALRKVAADVPAVASVDVHIRAGGVLEIVVRERTPVALWRGPDGLVILSKDGTEVGRLTHRAMRADLPLLAGEGADEAVAEALSIFAEAAPLSDRIRGLQRVGERRWDIVLDRGQIIQLPAHDAVQAVERVIALDTAQDLLARDIAVVDFRNEGRATVRLTQNSVSALRAIRMIENGAAPGTTQEDSRQ